ncbi:DUF6263 family protein [Mucilaginibacter boryungensis]|uniref:Gliding motility-associated protein GldM C-terminal domain-containing protein n=1 Tax=Mucilaginibacter boryungensis TaxID=768480 RepID=A0ABR9XHD4_9SPHI|nr:DUF6263 family protein [Mucilaginibacter boryungensis]MBE9666803.1 hypothetical protein [Mucilaginibacter boryungensis]
MKKTFIVTLCFLLPAIICRAQYVTLALNLTKGQTYYQNTNAVATVEQTVNGVKTTVTSTITGRIAFKITGIRDSLYDMEIRYERLSLKMQLPGGNIMAYNADKVQAGDPMSGIFAAFKNQPIKLVLTKTGNIQLMDGIDAIINRVVDNFTGADAGQKAQIKSMLQQSFGERGFRSNFELGTAIFPSIPVRKGVVWVINSQLQSARPANVHAIYDLRDITGTYYLIHVNSKIDYMNKDAFENSGSALMRYNLDGHITGDIVVDKMTGWVKQSTINQTIGGTTEVKTNALAAPSMVIPMVMKSDIVITGDN